MNVEYRRVSEFERGALYGLLADAYSFDGAYKSMFSSDWKAFDDFFFDNPSIADKYGFVTTLENKAIGFASWDPRHMPEYAIYGYNCISCAYKGRGYGKAQLKQAVSRIFKAGAQRIVVTTDACLMPAQRMYESVGFKLVNRRKNIDEDAFFDEYLDYVLDRELPV